MENAGRPMSTSPRPPLPERRSARSWVKRRRMILLVVLGLLGVFLFAGAVGYLLWLRDPG
jgi:hypothetical protein